MKIFWKKWIFLAEFHFQDPDPAWQFESGFTRIRNTDLGYGTLIKLRTPGLSTSLSVTDIFPTKF